MPHYKYEMQDTKGLITAGVVEAASLLEASNLLRNRGGYLLNVAPANGGAGVLTRLRTFRV